MVRAPPLRADDLPLERQPGSTSPDDDRLMAQFAAGDAKAFNELYARYEVPVYALCLRLLGDPDAAADAFQDSFIRLVDTRHDYHGQNRFRSWFFTVARNLCFDRLRHDRRWGRSLEFHADGPADPRPSVAHTVEFRDLVARILGALPRDQREVLLLHRYHGFSYAEIAEMTGSTETAIKQKAYRALIHLRRRSGPPVR